jgi:hypothetical protein
MKRTLLLAALATGAGTGAAHAQVAIGIGAGLTGLSGEVQVEVTPWLQIRGGYNYFEYDADAEEFDDVSYDGAIDLTSIGIYADLHPFSNSFVVSAGVLMFQGDNFLDLSATPTSNVEIGDVTYTPAEVGTLGFTSQFEEKTAPILLIGLDTTHQGNGGFGVKLLAGAVFSGSPQIDLSASGGTLSSDPAFQQELQDEEANLQDDLDEYEIIPVLQAGLTFGF